MSPAELLAEERARKIAELEGRAQPEPPPLRLSKHAWKRLHERGLRVADLYRVRRLGAVQVLKHGRRRYSLGLGNRIIQIILAAKDETVITVLWQETSAPGKR